MCRPRAGAGRCWLECDSLQTGMGPAPPVWVSASSTTLAGSPSSASGNTGVSPRQGSRGVKHRAVPRPTSVPQLKSGTLGPEEQTWERGKRSLSFHLGTLRLAPACSAAAGQAKRLASRSCVQGGFFSHVFYKITFSVYRFYLYKNLFLFLFQVISSNFQMQSLSRSFNQRYTG